MSKVNGSKDFVRKPELDRVQIKYSARTELKCPGLNFSQEHCSILASCENDWFLGMEVHRCHCTLVPRQLVQDLGTFHVPYCHGTIRSSDRDAASAILSTPSTPEEGVLEAGRRTSQHPMDAIWRGCEWPDIVNDSLRRE